MKKLKSIAGPVFGCGIALLSMGLAYSVEIPESYGSETVQVDVNKMPFGMEEIQKDLHEQLGL